MKKRTRVLSILIAALFLLSVVFSIVFLTTNAGHECRSSDDCVICTELGHCRELLGEYAVAQPAPKARLRLFSGQFRLPFSVPATRRAFFRTLVSLKVKLTS